jgi:hypothetical protein
MARPEVAAGGGLPTIPPDSYVEAFTAAGVQCLPVKVGRREVGYLWASEDNDAAGVARRLHSSRDTLRPAAAWTTRLLQAEREGLTPLRALRRWFGAVEDPRAGRIPGDAQQFRMGDVRALRRLVEQAPPPRVNPMDRSQGWDEPPVPPDARGYDRFRFVTPVRYLPVTRRGEVLGYLWASAADRRGCGYQPRVTAGADGAGAYNLWLPRLNYAISDGMTPLQALRRWIGAGEDPQGGGIAADAEERQAASPQALQELATIDTFIRYLPVVRGEDLLGYVWASEANDAVGYQPHLGAGPDGANARSLWMSRFDEARQDGFTPLRALRRWIGAGDDPQAGGIAADAEERQAPSPQALTDVATHP